MSRLTSIQQRISEVSAGIARFEQALTASPASHSLLLSLRSLENMRHSLEREFNEIAAAHGIDVCSYRLFNDAENPSIRSAFSACIEFQDLFSIVYAALRGGEPMDRSNVNRQVSQTTEFGLAYSFTGSIGFVLTLHNESMLFESRLDQAMHTVLEMARAGSADSIHGFYRQLGRAPMKALHDWASMHAKNGLGADIKWRRKEVVRDAVFIESKRLAQLSETLELKSAEQKDTIEIDFCILQGISTSRQTFSLEVPGIASPIVGQLALTIDRDHTVEVPAAYSATVERTIRRSLISDEDETTYLLLRLARRP